jgi:hypothetical protein
MADALDLGSSEETRGGSSPPVHTTEVLFRAQNETNLAIDRPTSGRTIEPCHCQRLRELARSVLDNTIGKSVGRQPQNRCLGRGDICGADVPSSVGHCENSQAYATNSGSIDGSLRSCGFSHKYLLEAEQIRDLLSIIQFSGQPSISKSLHPLPNTEWTRTPKAEQPGPMAKDPVITRLQKLQTVMRDRSEAGVSAGSSRLPRDFTEQRHIQITTVMREALDAAEQVLRNDMRFEHLAKPEDVVWWFACRCLLRRSESHVGRFMKRHALTPQSVEFFYAVEHLTFTGQLPGDGVVFRKKDDDRVPKLTTPFGGSDPYSCVCAVTVSGTSTANMAERGRVVVQQSLRRLRTALTGASFANKEQLRFRVGTTYATSEVGGGWQRRTSDGFPLDLTNGLPPTAEAAHHRLGITAANDIERRAAVAMEWIERAAFAADPLIETLFLFFGLEALLGDKSAGIKGPALAFRQIVLDHLVNGYFHDPGPTLLRYEQVRSAAVHGERVETVSAAEANDFSVAVRHTLLGYLQLANENGWTKRSELLTALDHDVDRPEFLNWVEQNNATGKWTGFLKSTHS